MRAARAWDAGDIRPLQMHAKNVVGLLRIIYRLGKQLQIALQ